MSDANIIPVAVCVLAVGFGFGIGILMPFRPKKKPDDLTRKDTKVLNSASNETLVDWYIELNGWGWPSEIPDEVTENTTGTRRSALMRAIENRVGGYAISHKWNTVGRHGFAPHMTEEEFQWWYVDPMAYYEAKRAAIEKKYNEPVAAQQEPRP